MTNHERAEKIGNKLIVSRCTGEPEFEELVDWIASQLDDACEEEYYNGVNVGWDVSGIIHGDDWKEGFASAREKAAGIALMAHGNCCNCENDCKDIAERIRAMESGEKL